MKKIIQTSLFVCFIFVFFSVSAQTRIACLGDSITEGIGTSDPTTQSWPAQLANFLGSDYTVFNAGVGGRTLLKNGDLPIWNEQKFEEAKDFDPDMVFICLGTNDSKPFNWNAHKQEFEQNYIDLINQFRQDGKNPEIYVCTPPPVFRDNFGITREVVRNEIIPIIKSVQKSQNTFLLDFDTTLQSFGSFFPDGIHPNDEGAERMARAVYNTIKSPSVGLQSGSIYSIISKISGKTINVADAGLGDNTNINSWTDTNSDAERWIATDFGNDVYTFTNVASKKLLHLAEPSPINGTNVDQFFDTDDNTVRWKVIDDGNGYFHIVSMADENFALDLSSGGPENGANIYVWGKNDLDLQKWSFQLEQPQDVAPTPAIVDKMFEAWSSKYDIVNDSGFWGTAEMMEIVLDAYETTGNLKYKTMFDQMYVNFIRNNGEDWMNNDFNDDIAWISIACVRSYLLTGNETHLNKAVDQFNKMYNRAKTGDFDEGLIWKQGVFGTNSAINGPAMVAMCYLAQATGDTSYYDKAIAIYQWAKEYMFDTETGKVIDAYYRNTETGQMEFNNWSSTYNQGTHLGASVMLFNYTKDPEYLRIADNIARFTQWDMFFGGVMNSEDFGNDAPGFKGIFMRYARRYVTDANRPGYLAWLQLNAKVAYNNRNSENITSTLWATRTKEDDTGTPFSSSTAVSLWVNTRDTKEEAFIRDAYETIEAEDFDYLSGVIVEPSPDGTSNLGGIQDGNYTAYYNIDFGDTGSESIDVRAASFSGGTIEVRQDGINGELIGTVEIPGTEDWNLYSTITTPVEKVTGLQNIYLVYKGEDFILNLNRFKFNELDGGEITNGLSATYYNGSDFESKVFERIDPAINFVWDSNSPAAGINPDYFSIRWTGQIEPRYSGTYTFYINSDNGRRLWINDELVIDKWINDWDVEYSGSIDLDAGQRYNIRVEYFEAFGGASILMEWESNEQVREIVPNSQLFPKSSQTLSINEAEFNPIHMSIYPNPASDYVAISATKDIKLSGIQVVDTLGKIVLDISGKNFKDQKINISELKAGLYFIILNTTKKQFKSKLIVK